MLFTIASEFGSIGSSEISRFQSLSGGKIARSPSAPLAIGPFDGAEVGPSPAKTTRGTIAAAQTAAARCKKRRRLKSRGSRINPALPGPTSVS
jgi:hypothetical protein